MRYTLAVAILSVTTICLGADEPPMATRVIEGPKTTFPAKSIPEWVKVLACVLEPCLYMSDGIPKYTVDDVKKAQKGDHVQFVFPKPLKVEILSKKLEVSEAVYADGAFWLACDKEVVRCAKYTHDKWCPFLEWYQQTLPAN